jgi:hypothetical protein
MHHSGQYKKLKADPNNQFTMTDVGSATAVPATPRARKRATDTEGGGSATKKPRAPKTKKVKEEVIDSIEGDDVVDT